MVKHIIRAIWLPFIKSPFITIGVVLMLSGCQSSPKPSPESIQVNYTEFEANAGGVEKLTKNVWVTHSPATVKIGDSNFTKPDDPNFLILLKKGLSETYEHHITTGNSTPTLITEWQTADGKTQSHWFIVLNGTAYWQWAETAAKFNESASQPMWFNPSDVAIIFPDQEIFETPSASPESEHISDKSWELFDGETMEVIQDPERDWLLKKSPAEVLGLTEDNVSVEKKQ